MTRITIYGPKRIEGTTPDYDRAIDNEVDQANERIRNTNRENLARLREANELARQIVVNVTGIDDLIDRWEKHGYRPTIDCNEGPRYQRLADLYDWRAEQRGLDVRAFRLSPINRRTR